MIMCPNVFNVWPKTTLLLPVWPRDTKRLGTPAYSFYPCVLEFLFLGLSLLEPSTYDGRSPSHVERPWRVEPHGRKEIYEPPKAPDMRVKK